MSGGCTNGKNKYIINTYSLLFERVLCILITREYMLGENIHQMRRKTSNKR